MASTIGFKRSARTPALALPSSLRRPPHPCPPSPRTGRFTVQIPSSVTLHQAVGVITSRIWGRHFRPLLPSRPWPEHSQRLTRSSRCQWTPWTASPEILMTMISTRRRRCMSSSQPPCHGAARTRIQPAHFCRRNLEGHRMTSRQVYIPQLYRPNLQACQHMLNIQAENHVEVCLITSAMC